MIRRNIVDCLRKRLSRSGIDIVQPFALPVDFTPAFPVLPFPQEPKGNLAVLIGATKAQWEPFIEAMATSHEDILHGVNPLDTYTKGLIEGAAEEVGETVPEVKVATWYPWDDGARFVAFQQLGHVAGMGYYFRPAALSIHPVLGAWFSFRAVLVFSCDFNAGDEEDEEVPPPEPKCPLSAGEEEAISAEALRLRDFGFSDPNWWKDWVELRSMTATVETAHHHRYSDAQIAYHYTKSKEGLIEEVRLWKEEHPKDQE